MKYQFSWPLMFTLALLPVKGMTSPNEFDNAQWGVGIGIRSASIPFDTSGNNVNDVIPLLYYQGDNLYLDGASGGYRFFKNDMFSVGVKSELRFFDIPRYAQNVIQGTHLDVGGEATWHYSRNIDVGLAVMSDSQGKIYSYLSSSYAFQSENWEASLYARLRAKSASFNNTYYGLNIDDIGVGLDTQVGVKGKAQLYGSLYAVGHLGVTFYDHATYSSEAVDSHYQWESYLGMAVFGEGLNSTAPKFKEGAYLRLAYGVATESGPTDLLFLDNQTDPDRNTMTSVFYGHPLNGTIFGWPLDFYLTPGYIQHWSSDTQGSFSEYVVAIKAYYTLDWGVRARLGFAEGVSYSSEINHSERKRLAEKEYQPSKLMNYLDFSVDVNVGDLFSNSSLDQLWLGYSLHHRSGIFTSTSAFGRIKGGSDYNSLYLQWHF